MGIFNSSLYRVRPLMEAVENDVCAFRALLSLVDIAPLGAPQCFRYDGKNCSEIQLKPTQKHLCALIDLMATKTHTTSSVRNRDRAELFSGDPQTRSRACERAKSALKEAYATLKPSDKAWFLFEGFSNPDIFIEGEDYVIVCEGKWTEPHLTTTTAHLCAKGEYRSQMVRHIQGAMNCTDKKVYAFYIVDESCSYRSELTKESFPAQLERETIPLGQAERSKIRKSFYGYTTWQEIQRTIPSVVFLPKEKITL